MLNFQPFDTDSAALLRPLFSEQKMRCCDYTLGANYQWQRFYDYSFAVKDEMLFIRANYPGRGVCQVFPVGSGSVAGALSEIDAETAEQDIPLYIMAPTEEAVAELKRFFGSRVISVQPMRALYDYLYLTESLRTFSGKKLHGQRNYLNRFFKEHPEAEYVPVSDETLPEAEAFLDAFEKETELSSRAELLEMEGAKRLLHNAKALGMTAGFIRTADGIVALSVGETVGDTVYVHVEKASRNFPGAYQAIVSSFLSAVCTPETLYCNREDDSGDQGLRASKQAYHPCGMVEKYWVTIENESKRGKKTVTLKELAMKRESCRAYLDLPVSDEDLKDIIETAILAPSARNRQPWHFYLCTGETAEKIGECTRAVEGMNPWSEECHAFIVVASEQHPKERFGLMYDFGIVDAGIVLSYITLAAAEKGLGTCIIGAEDEAAIKRILSVPDDQRIYCSVAVGYPASEPKGVKNRRAYDEFVTVMK